MPEDRKPGIARIVFPPPSARFWGLLSGLVSLFSLTLPWWGIDIATWGVLPVPTQPNVTFFVDRLNHILSQNYSFITALVVLTSALAALGGYLRRWPLLASALVSSAVTIIAFLVDVGDAVSADCANFLPPPPNCISGVVGNGIAGLSYASWGFKSGFYVFIASGLLTLTALTLQLQWNRSRGFPR